MKQRFDVVIAGAGAGGGFAAMVLTQQGLKVLLLERGKRFDFSKDFPMNHPDWELRPRAFNARVGTIVRRRGAPIQTEDADICSGRFDEGGELYQRARSHRGPFNYQRALGLGGSTLHYQGEAHRYPEHAFYPEKLYGWGKDWPFGYETLAPYYEVVEKTLGVAGVANNPYKSARGGYPTPAHALSTTSQFAKQGADKLGWSLLQNSLALPSISIDGRVPCQHSGGCVQGCAFGAKSSVDITAIRQAEATNNLTVMTRARLLQIETDKKGEVSGFLFMHEGETKRARADKYILALGAIETPRMLLASQGERHVTGIGNQADNVGRNFMETISLNLLCQADQPLHSYKGPPLDARIWDFAKPQAALRSGYVLGVSGVVGGRQSPLSYAWSLPGIGLEHKNNMRTQFGRDIQLFGIAEHIAHPDNRVILSKKLDQDGVPRVEVHSDYGPDDRKTLRAMKKSLFQWADACELNNRRGFYSSYDVPGAAHVGGTCRMGIDSELSVTNVHGQIHGMDNLYIADASLLPTLGAGDSPSLTIQALAVRVATGIAGS